MSKSSTRASYILTCLSFSDVGLSNVTSLVENLFSPSKVSSLVVVVVMVVGGGGGGPVPYAFLTAAVRSMC